MSIRHIFCVACFLVLTTYTASANDHPSPTEVIDPDSWVMVMLPDIQSYNDHSEHYPLLEQITEWIASEHENLNIELVVQVGDIVFQNAIPFAALGSGDQNSTQQWTNAREAFGTLDSVIPYILCPGNHDYGLLDADDRITQFTDYFSYVDNPLNDPSQGGILRGLGPNAQGIDTLENAYYEFKAPDGREFLILSLEWGPRQAIVDWANVIAGLDAYYDHTKVLITHAYMYHDDSRYNWEEKGKDQGANPHVYKGTLADTNDGEELFKELVRKYNRFELVLSGHVGGDMVGYLESENDHGQSVHQMLFNAQFLPLGGEGWIRLLEFTPDSKTVNVHTFSPYFYLDDDPTTVPWRTDPDDSFSFTLTPIEDSTS